MIKFFDRLSHSGTEELKVTTVNGEVVGSNPTLGAFFKIDRIRRYFMHWSDYPETAKLQHRYENILKLVKERKVQIDNFIKYLEDELDWLSCPASSRHHLCRPFGLIEHSINVTENLLKVKDLFHPIVSDESCVIVALFHDIGKIGYPGKPNYVPNMDENRRTKPYNFNKDITFIDYPTRSLVLMLPHVSMTEEEIQAIRYHDGQYIPENKNVAQRELPLTRLLHFADIWSLEQEKNS